MSIIWLNTIAGLAATTAWGIVAHARARNGAHISALGYALAAMGSATIGLGYAHAILGGTPVGLVSIARQYAWLAMLAPAATILYELLRFELAQSRATRTLKNAEQRAKHRGT